LLEGYRPAVPALLAPIWYSLGIAERLRGDFAAGLAAQQRALTLFGDGPAAALDRVHVQTEMGLDLLGVGRAEDARTRLQDAVSGFAATQLALTPQHADALHGLGLALDALGQSAEACARFTDAAAHWRTAAPSSPWHTAAEQGVVRTCRPHAGLVTADAALAATP
jgi:tetratricopeptide (TPR) repeat protein